MIFYCKEMDELVLLLGLDAIESEQDALVSFGGDGIWIDSGHLHNLEFVGWL